MNHSVQIDTSDSVFARITTEGFSCIYSFFLLLNMSKKKILRLLPYNLTTSNQGTVQGYPPKKFSAYSSQTGESYQNFSFNQNKNSSSAEEELEFHIMVPPWELDGI